MADRVIEEMEEKEENEEIKPKAQSIQQIYQNLHLTNREVHKFVSGMPSHESIIGSASHEGALRHYGNYGRAYRFQERQRSLMIEKAQVEPCLSEPIEKEKIIDDRRTQLIKHQTQQDSMLGHDGVKYPSQHYYIYFQDEQRKSKEKSKPKQQRKKKLQRTSLSWGAHNTQQLKTDSKPEWIMERKIRNLQKQVKELKQKEQMISSGMNSKQFRHTDQPIRMKNNIQRMVESLWK